MDSIGAPLENLTSRVPTGNGVCGQILACMGVDIPEIAPDAKGAAPAALSAPIPSSAPSIAPV